MSEKTNLGLFLSKNKAIAVWLSSESDASITRAQTIALDPDQSEVIALKAARVAVQQTEEFDEVSVAIDCALYTQYKLHSEFEDYHQIQSTIKFDAEEAAATDAMNLAVAFDITGKASIGSEVTVYTADRQLLTDMLLDMQEGQLDPSFMEPDVACLARGLSYCANLKERTDAMFVVLSRSSCYMIRPHADFEPAGRTFLIAEGQDVTGLLSREIMLASGVAASAEPLTSIILMGEQDNVDTGLLAQRTGLNVQTATPEKELLRALETNSEAAAHEILIAYGAALASRTRAHKTDFRCDFMPYQGHRKQVQSNLRIISIALTILLVSVAVFFQLKTFRMKGYTRELRKKIITEHNAIGLKPKSNESFDSKYSKLTRAIREAKQMQEGIGPGGDKSVPAKLTFFFEALTETPTNVDVQVQQITITERSMKVKGDINSSGTQVFFKQIKSHPRINISSERVTPGANGRDGFEITLEPKKSETRR